MSKLFNRSETLCFTLWPGREQKFFNKKNSVSKFALFRHFFFCKNRHKTTKSTINTPMPRKIVLLRNNGRSSYVPGVGHTRQSLSSPQNGRAQHQCGVRQWWRILACGAKANPKAAAPDRSAICHRHSGNWKRGQAFGQSIRHCGRHRGADSGIQWSCSHGSARHAAYNQTGTQQKRR